MKRRSVLGAVVILASVAGVVVAAEAIDSGGPAILSVELVDSGPIADNETRNGSIPFESLNQEQQQVFTEAVNSDNMRSNIPMDVDDDVWAENEYVRYEDSTYRVRVAVS